MVTGYGINGGIAEYAPANDIFAAKYDPDKCVEVVLKAATATYKRGQVFSLEAASGKYVAIANKAAFAAATTQVGILLNDITLANADASAVLVMQGNFIQQSLTPSDIPAGPYANGCIIIEKEVV